MSLLPPPRIDSVTVQGRREGSDCVVLFDARDVDVGEQVEKEVVLFHVEDGGFHGFAVLHAVGNNGDAKNYVRECFFREMQDRGSEAPCVAYQLIVQSLLVVKAIVDLSPRFEVIRYILKLHETPGASFRSPFGVTASQIFCLVDVEGSPLGNKDKPPLFKVW